MPRTVKTNLNTLKVVWGIFKDLEIEGLLTGEAVDLSLAKLIDGLLTQGKINEFCQTITGEKTDFEELEIKEVIELISLFFLSTKEQFGELKKIVTAREKTPSQINASQPTPTPSTA